MIKSNSVLDATGLACPMPIVRTKKTINGMDPGQVLEIQATDKGSTADMKAWAESTGHQYLGTVEEGNILKHYLRKSSAEEQTETKHEHIVSNNDLQIQLEQKNNNIIVLDVREPAEYAFSHIPNAKSLPLGELDERLSELNHDAEIFVICRTGSRSDLAAQKLTSAGFKLVKNVLPGMSEWNGAVEKFTI